MDGQCSCAGRAVRRRLLACYGKAREADAHSRFIESLEAMTLAMAGRRAEAKAMLETIMRRAANDYISRRSASHVYVHGAGRQGPAHLRIWTARYNDRDSSLLGIKSNPIFEPLRTDERYHAILRKMQLAGSLSRRGRAIPLLGAGFRAFLTHIGRSARDPVRESFRAGRSRYSNAHPRREAFRPGNA